MLTVDVVKERVAEIAAMVAAMDHESDGNEEAHVKEDALLIEVLRDIAKYSRGRVAEIAGEALKTLDLKFCRWYS